MLSDPIGLIALAALCLPEQLCHVVVEYPLLQNHGIRAPQQQLLNLPLLPRHLLIVGVLIDYSCELFSQDLPGPLEGADSQRLQIPHALERRLVEGKDPVVKGDHRLGEVGAAQHAGSDVDDGIQLAFLQHAEGPLQRQIDELGLMTAAGERLAHEVELDAAILVRDHIGRDGEAHPHSQRLGDQRGGKHQQDEAQQATKVIHAGSRGSDSSRE